jgi:hypothetical protein
MELQAEVDIYPSELERDKYIKKHNCKIEASYSYQFPNKNIVILTSTINQNLL